VAKLTCLILFVLTASCQAKRGEVVYELTQQQKRNGVVREIECVTAHSVVRFDGDDVGVTMSEASPPLEAVARVRFFTPLTEKSYFETCEEASIKSNRLAQKKIKELSANLAEVEENDFNVKEESIYPGIAEDEEDVRWPEDDRYDKDFREGTCRCKDRRAELMNRPVYCTQIYSFDLIGGVEGERCFGYFTKAMRRPKRKDLPVVLQRGYCERKTRGWLRDCRKNQKTYKESQFFRARNFEPTACSTDYELSDETFEHECQCSTNVLNLIPYANVRFFCSKVVGGEEVILNFDSMSGN